MMRWLWRKKYTIAGILLFPYVGPLITYLNREDDYLPYLVLLFFGPFVYVVIGMYVSWDASCSAPASRTHERYCAGATALACPGGAMIGS